MLDLPPARFAVAGGNFRLGIADFAKEPLPYRHREVVLLPLQAVCSSDPAAVDVELDDAQLRDQREQVESRLPDSVTLLLARRVIRNDHRKRVKVCPQTALVVQVQQELTEVPHVLTHHAQ